MGEHKLLCADPREPKSYELLLEGAGLFCRPAL